MKLLLFSILVAFANCGFAQDSIRIFIPAGSKVSDIPMSRIYRFASFTPGRILFKDNQTSSSTLNYNYLNGEIMFVDPKGDTLAIAKEQMLNVKRVYIDTSQFVYSNGYLEVMKENSTGSLAKRQQYLLVSREKIGGYDFASPTSAIDSYTSFTDRADNRHNLVVRENINLKLRTTYFIGDPYRLYLPVNKKNLEKIFFKKRPELATYLKEHTIDFGSEKDVSSLFDFLSQPS